MNIIIRCPLCFSGKADAVKGPDARDYYLCISCGLISAGREHRLSAEEEKARYESHNNSPECPGYVDFLNRAVKPALGFISKGMRGLDYGCGPEPVLSRMVEREGVGCAYYDPYFFPDIDESAVYDFIFSTECFEHFFSPSVEIDRIYGMLKRGGILTVMSRLWKDAGGFEEWYYPRDPSHMAFYSLKTVGYISDKWGMRQVFSDGESVFILRKS